MSGGSIDSRIPYSRIPERNSLIRKGLVEHFLQEDIAFYDPAKGLAQRAASKMLSFDGVSRSFGFEWVWESGWMSMLLEMVKPNVEYEALIQATWVSHGGRSLPLPM